MNKSFLQIVLWEFREFYRNPAILFWSMGFPIILSIVLGYAFFQKKQPVIKIGILSEKGKSSFTLPGKENQARFVLIPVTSSDVNTKIKKGEISLYIEIKNSQTIFHLDPKNQEAYLSYLELKNILRESPEEKETTILIPIDSSGNRYIDYLIPGILALGIMNSCLWGTGYSLMDMRIKKLLKRIIASPLPKWIFLSAHLFTRILLSGFEFLVVFFVSGFFFDVKMQGSVLGAALIFFTGMISFFGIAVFISSRGANTQVANGLINTVGFPFTLLCGVFYSYQNFPDWAVSIIRYLPLSLVSDTLRSIFNEGAGFSAALFPSLILTLTSLFFVSVGIKIYKWD